MFVIDVELSITVDVQLSFASKIYGVNTPQVVAQKLRCQLFSKVYNPVYNIYEIKGYDR